MTHLSLFTGIGGFDLGFELAGIETVAQVETNKFCLQVLRTRWPEVPRHEEIRDFDGREYRGVGVISGGFPCQGLSVAGRRAGLADPRSGLFFEMCRVVGEAEPEFVVWENVAGLLGSREGRDFATVLGTLADLGYCGAWRMLDSQYFGVPQRRQRLFGMFARRDIGWRGAATVLLEPEGGGWDPEEGRAPREETLNVVERGPSLGSEYEWGAWLAPNCSYALNAAGSRRFDAGNETFVVGVGSCAKPERHRTREAAGLPRGLDSARYRALGNAVTVNVAYWIGCRLMGVKARAGLKPGPS